MNAIRTTFTALILAAAGVAQAGEITNFPLEKSIASRLEVQAAARTVRSGPGELYDGTQLAAKPMPASTKSRDEVRMEARLGTLDRVMQNDRVGGM
jgi:hypothetical protein